MNLKKNMGLPDRIARVVLATIAPVLYVTEVISGTFGIVLLVITVILLVTSLFKFCPLYGLFGINTDKKINK